MADREAAPAFHAIIAVAAAAAIPVIRVLPAEYAIDPAGIGRSPGLTETGEIKAQLARKRNATADRGRRVIGNHGRFRRNCGHARGGGIAAGDKPRNLSGLATPVGILDGAGVYARGFGCTP